MAAAICSQRLNGTGAIGTRAGVGFTTLALAVCTFAERPHRHCRQDSIAKSPAWR